MKVNLLFTTIALFLNSAIQAQTVTIPDPIFKLALVNNPSINTNGDDSIQVSEAQAFTGTISVASRSITDLTGIEAFTALTELDCFNNHITSIDVSNNVALTQLYCKKNPLYNLDVSNNTALLVLSCKNNYLSSLDISNNTALLQLYCNGNQLTSLDFSNHPDLTIFDCRNNQLTSLNIKNGTNTNISSSNFFTTDNPNLSCIEVDDVSYSVANWTNIDPATSFSTDCNLSTNKIAKGIGLSAIYPNPTTKNLTVSLNKRYATITAELYNTLGQLVLNKNYTETEELNIALEGLSGFYFLTVETEEGTTIIKILKE